MHTRPLLASIYLIGDQDEYAIIETGTCHSIPHVIQALSDLNIDKEQIKFVIPTHIHLDHVGGASQMMDCFPHANLIIHPKGSRHVINPEKLIAGSMAVYGKETFEKMYGQIKPISESRVIIADDMHTESLGNRKLLFIDTPGHARHHFCIVDEQSQGIFTGDTFGLAYPGFKEHKNGLIPTTSPVHFDPDAMKNSIEKLLSFNPCVMYLTHFGELPQPQQYKQSLYNWIDSYVRSCERVDPKGADDDVKHVEMNLWELTKEQFSDLNIDINEMKSVLGMDIQLSAQGLVHWWKTSHV